MSNNKINDKKLKYKNFKTDEEIKNHFILRLQERYGISLSDEEYIELNHPKGLNKSKLITGVIIRWVILNGHRKVLILKIKDKMVLAIYCSRRSKFITALPWESHSNEERLIPGIFKKLNLREEALKKYNEIISICSKEYVDLGNARDNHIFYKKCTYPHLLMSEYKGFLTVGAIFDMVEKELSAVIDERKILIKKINKQKYLELEENLITTV